MSKAKSGLTKDDRIAIASEIKLKGPVPTAEELNAPDRSIADMNWGTVLEGEDETSNETSSEDPKLGE